MRPGLAAVTALALVAASALLVASASQPLGRWGVSWPTYKYSMTRSGYVDLHRLYPGFHYVGFRVLWKVKTQLCISSSPAVGDLNGDGRPEVAFSSCDGHLYVVDGATGRILWNSTTGGGFASPTIWDLDGDGRPEVVVMGASGVVYAFNGEGREEWEVAGYFLRGSVGVADVNGDGRYEVLAPSFDGRLYVIDYRGRVLESIRVGPYPVSTPAIADVNGDGRPDAVVTDGSYVVLAEFGPGGKASVYSIKVGGDLVGPPALYDLNGDGHPDAVVVSHSCRVSIVDLARERVEASLRLPGASECYSPPSVGDVNGDGKPDIVVGSLQGLYVLSANLSVEYSFPEVKVYTSSPIIGDVDGDGRNEIVVGQESGEVDVIDVSHAGQPYEEIEWFLETGAPIMGSAAIADVNGDGSPEILIGSRDFNLYCITGIKAPTTTTTLPGPTSTSHTQASTEAAATTPSPAGEGVHATPGPAGGRASVDWVVVAGAVVAALLIVAAATLYARR
ncbi:MAG: FG-GAP-like repeat-containing protein [Desulfurococcales archaeon]|nr:FG-GAP-like repeat-containing protein [Desulfurococcales archaeon]